MELFTICRKTDSKSYKCECGKETELVNLKPLYTKCKCGNEFKYMTNMNTAEFTYKCFTCGSPVDVKMNSRRTAYITIGGGTKGYSRKLARKYGASVSCW